MKYKYTKHIPEFGGWLGMVLIHCATLPTSIAAILGWSSHFPPINMIVMIWAGLFLFFIRAWYRFDKLYLVSNGVGFTFQSILLYLAVTSAGS